MRALVLAPNMADPWGGGGGAYEPQFPLLSHDRGSLDDARVLTNSAAIRFYSSCKSAYLLLGANQLNFQWK